MAEDNEHKGLSKTSPWENELCQAAREATSGKLDPGEEVLAAVATDYCLIALTDRNLRTIDRSRSKILLTWPLAEIKNLRVEQRSGGTWLRFETTQGEHRKESLVGDWALFGEAVEEFLTSGRVARDSNFTHTLAETIDWYVERGFRVIMQAEETAQLVRPKTFSVGWLVLFGPFYLIYHIFVKREEQVYLKPQDIGQGE